MLFFLPFHSARLFYGVMCERLFYDSFSFFQSFRPLLDGGGGEKYALTALTMLLYNVAMNPDVEQKIYDEVIHLSRDHSRDFMRQRSG